MKQGHRPENYPLRRNAHYLRSSEAVGSPGLSVALALYTETVPGAAVAWERQVRLRAWHALAWGDTARRTVLMGAGTGRTAEEWWAWLLRVQSQAPATWIWQLGAAHGLTVLGFWQLLETGQWTIPGMEPVHLKAQEMAPTYASRGVCVLSDPPTIILARRAQVTGTVRLLDARNLGLDGWEALSRDTGSANLSDARPGHPDGICAILAAARAETLAHWLQHWQQLVADLKLGGLRSTAAAQAWHGWRHTYLSTAVLVHNNEAAINLERCALHPGRCEAARLGRCAGPIYQLDASAFYPGCAGVAQLPCRLVHVRRGNWQDAARLAQQGYCIVAEGATHTAEPVAPVRHNGLTVWPVGSFRTTLCWPEWELLRDNGANVRITQFAVYEPGQPFGQFFASLWSERQRCEAERRSARAGCVKRLMNALIGKLAQWDWGWIGAPGALNTRPYEVWEGLDPRVSQDELTQIARAVARNEPGAKERIPCARWRSLAWHTQWERCNGESEDSLPVLTAWVCSLARVQLWKWIETAGRDHVMYYDTDSLWVDHAGFVRLGVQRQLKPGKMGGLRIVKRHEWLDVRGCKYYLTPDGLTCAGVSHNHHVARDGGWLHWSPERVQDALGSGREPHAAELSYLTPEKRPYAHGTVRDDGSIVPLVLNER